MSLRSVLGQQRALRMLGAFLASGRVPAALLFHGPEGVGKSLAARLFAKALRCERAGPEDCCDQTFPCPSCQEADAGLDPDVRTLDAAYQAGLEEEEEAKQRTIKVDTVRHLIREVEMRSTRGRWKVAIVEDAHRMADAAANAMLKALEEPPPRTVWVLLTPRRERLLATIRSRCQAVPFVPLAPAAVAKVLAGLGVPAAEAAALGALCEGSPGRALALRERPLPEPSEWLGDPMGPLRLAEGLPRELHLSRPAVEDHLRRMAWHLRRARGWEGYSDPAVRDALRELSALRRSLDSNADPRVVLELAALRLQGLGAR